MHFCSHSALNFRTYAEIASVFFLFVFTLVLFEPAYAQADGTSSQPKAIARDTKATDITKDIKEDSPEEDSIGDESATEDEFDEFMGDVPEIATTDIYDPLEPVNRVSFIFNDKLYFWVLKPVCTGYNYVVYKPIRVGFRNFFNNIASPARIVNAFLQGKGEKLGNEVGRFMLNTTIGLLGFLDPAQDDPRLNHSSEDLGQTLAVYGIGDGCYLYLPIFGPSSVRDAVGLAGDGFLSPINYVQPLEVSLGISAFESINKTSFKIGEYESLKSASLEPYGAIRNIYAQYRRKVINE